MDAMLLYALKVKKRTYNIYDNYVFIVVCLCMCDAYVAHRLNL